MEQQQINDIIEKYKQGIASPVELEQLNNWYRDNAYLDAEYPDSEQEVHDRIITRLNSKINPVQRRRTKLWPSIAVAAAILLVVGTGLFLYTNTLRHPDAGQDPAVAGVNDIAPGKFGATLTLANGTQIVLSDAKNGKLAKESGVNITKTADGRIIYEILKQVKDDENTDKTNTLSTAKGETYQVRLPDGTSIWLNAASTLKYPASFEAHKNRRVELSGEAYFEVAKDKAHPFIVSSSKQEVEVLGTHFNINSYADEPATKTTLLEGSVRVSSSLIASRYPNTPRHPDPARHPEFISGSRTSKAIKDEVILKPNQQSVLTTTNQILVKYVEPEDAIAWKNGYFMFNTETLEEVMNRVARWYDVNVQYQNQEVKKLKFSGTMSRYDNISQILKKIATISNVSYSIKGKTVFLK